MVAYTTIKTYIKVFTFGFLIDLMFVLWMVAVASGSAFLAGLAAVGVSAPGLLGYLEITTNRKMMYPYLLGLFTGTVCATLLKGYIL